MEKKNEVLHILTSRKYSVVLTVLYMENITLLVLLMLRHHIAAINIYITRIIKNISNKNERRCRDVKTQKACEQG